MFGIRIVTEKGLKEIKRVAKNQALAELVALLRCKDRIFIEPMTLIGNGQTIQNCIFLSVDPEAPVLTIVEHGTDCFCSVCTSPSKTA